MKTMLLSLLAVLGVIGSSQQAEMCPEIRGLVPFDYVKFEGDWFTLARINIAIAPHDDAVCWKNHIESNGTRMSADTLFKFKDGSSHRIDIKGRFPDLQNKGAVLESVFSMGQGQPYKGMVTETILATDYTGFALHYGCLAVYNEETDQFSRLIAAEVWSRTPTMDPEALEALRVVVSSTSNVEASAITNVDQSGCD